MTARRIADRIRAANHGRVPELLARKYALMRANPFVFFRGTAHLFFEDWPTESFVNAAPMGWLCGDLHVENFGCYKGVERLTYFDVNDFDEACIGPVTWDITRLLTSMLLGAPLWGLSGEDADRLMQAGVEAYASALATGKARWVERDMAQGVVKKLFRGLGRSRTELLDQRTEVRRKRRTFVTDEVRLFPATSEQRAFAAELVTMAEVSLTHVRYARRQSFFVVDDVARRVAGVGSLGAQRYVALIEGKGSPDRNVLLDLKEALPASTARRALVAQPMWASDADRVVATQRHLQAESPALLTAVRVGATSFVVKELQPTEDKLDLVRRSAHVTTQLIRELCRVAAWMHLRGSGWHGAASVDDYIAFGADPSWPAAVCRYARAYAKTVEADFAEFSAAYDGGAFRGRE